MRQMRQEGFVHPDPPSSQGNPAFHLWIFHGLYEVGLPKGSRYKLCKGCCSLRQSGSLVQTYCLQIKSATLPGQISPFRETIYNTEKASLQGKMKGVCLWSCHSLSTSCLENKYQKIMRKNKTNPRASNHLLCILSLLMCILSVLTQHKEHYLHHTVNL